MTRYVVTGSRPPRGGYTNQERSIGLAVLAMFNWGPNDSLCTGGATGWDAEAMRYGRLCGMHIVTVLPASDKFTDKAAVRLYSDQVIDSGLGYWKRDDYEVNWGGKVIALPLYERGMSSRWSGTWHTWDSATEDGKATLLVVIRPVSEMPYVRGHPDLTSQYRRLILAAADHIPDQAPMFP